MKILTLTLISDPNNPRPMRSVPNITGFLTRNYSSNGTLLSAVRNYRAMGQHDGFLIRFKRVN